MKKDNITIGTFCSDMKIQPSKLRYYESLGLIQPAMIDEENGYHYYSYAQYAEIEIIQICRKLNFPLKKIIHLQKTQDPHELLELIAKQKFHARKLLLQQQEIYQNLSWLHEALEADMELREGDTPDIVCQELEERKVLMALPEPGNHKLSLEEQEAALQYELSKTVSSEHFAVNSIQRTYGYHLDFRRFQQGQLRILGKFVELPQYIMNIETKLYSIPAGTYLILPVQAFSETDWIQRMCTYASAHHLKIQAVYLTEVALHLIPRKDAFYKAQLLVQPES
ncbi:MAG: MerR family transcriptional regulator [Ruminococcus sp.]